jgi:hypothetical protein
LSRRYLKNVDPALLKEYFSDPQIGQPVRLTAAYVDGALGSFEATGLLLGFTCWVKLHQDHSDAQSSLLDDYVYEMMLAGRWNVVLPLTTWGAEQQSFDANSRTTFRINGWLAMKRLGRWSESVKEVENFDCSALRPIFAAARAALLDDADRFFELVEEHNGAELGERAWREWPLFDQLRADVRFGKFRERFSPPKRDEPSVPQGNSKADVRAPESSFAQEVEPATVDAAPPRRAADSADDAAAPAG